MFFMVRFLTTYGYAKLQTEREELLLVPNEQPTGKPIPEGVSFPIPIPREKP